MGFDVEVGDDREPHILEGVRFEALQKLDGGGREAVEVLREPLRVDSVELNSFFDESSELSLRLVCLLSGEVLKRIQKEFKSGPAKSHGGKYYSCQLFFFELMNPLSACLYEGTRFAWLLPGLWRLEKLDCARSCLLYTSPSPRA